MSELQVSYGKSADYNSGSIARTITWLTIIYSTSNGRVVSVSIFPSRGS